MAQKILILGAGRSSAFLIQHLVVHAPTFDAQIMLADASPEVLQAKKAQYPTLLTFCINIEETQSLASLLSPGTIVVSLLPAFYQPQVAQLCLSARAHLLTASYLPPEMEALHEAARTQNLLFLNELGLDPGLDHLSACKLLDEIRAEGGIIDAFRSYAGALVAPEAEQDNPWSYKFTWNPRNVVLAGQGGPAQYRQDGQTRLVPAHQLFRRVLPVSVAGAGDFEAYPNRDSLKYAKVYGLETVPTLLRGTLRRPGFCQAWHWLVQLGLTDDQVRLPHSESLTYREWLQAFLPDLQANETVWAALARYCGLSTQNPTWAQLAWLELDREQAIGLPQASSAQILQKILEGKWQLQPQDCDMVVMHHEIIYQKEGQRFSRSSDLVVKGAPSPHTAIAKTVGLPLAMAAVRLATGQLNLRGVCLPTAPELYLPLLEQLKQVGIRFEESITLLEGKK
ncbi:MAG: saccharopine dehydrogenase [Microscillaceae bacterium]|nr:saccharopine dehydrogenase [Microscillaceae bacterium]